MSHFEPTNAKATRAGTARLTLLVFAALWVALVAWALRNDARLFERSAEPRSRVAATGALPGAGTGSVAEPSTTADADAGAAESTAEGTGRRAGEGDEERAGSTATDADPDAGADVRPDGAQGATPGTGTDTDDVGMGGGTEVDAFVDDVTGADVDAGGGDDAIVAGGVAATSVRADVATGPDDAAEGDAVGTAVGAEADVETDAEADAEADVEADVETDGAASTESDADPEAAADGTTPIGDDAPPATESAFERRRREELETLESLLEDVAFEPRSDVVTDGARAPLDLAFEILFLYPRTRIDLVVESRETGDPASDRRLDRARGARVVDYLVSRGIERERLVAGTGDGRGLPFGEHRVRVSVEDEER